jgi:5-methylcytosine-specific restriction protein A
MVTILSVQQWFEILNAANLHSDSSDLCLKMFQVLYHAPDYQLPGGKIGSILGCHHGKLNLAVYHYAELIATQYEIQFTKKDSQKYSYWDLFFDGWNDGRDFIWKLRPDLCKALQLSGLADWNDYPEEIPVRDIGKLTEGATKTIRVNSYERNPEARRQCIKKFGLICSVCGFNFEQMYGEIGKDFIHVHHVIPLSDIRKEYEITPDDLMPVCPNCHAMLHRNKGHVLRIEELKEIIRVPLLNPAS